MSQRQVLAKKVNFIPSICLICLPVFPAGVEGVAAKMSKIVFPQNEL